MVMMTNSALYASDDIETGHCASSCSSQSVDDCLHGVTQTVDRLRTCDVDALLRENVAHLIAKNTSLNSLNDYSGLLEYLSKNTTLSAVSFLGISSFHEKKWIELHECLSQNKSIEKVHFDNVTLNALTDNSNPRVKKVLSRDLLDTLSKQYADRTQGTMVAIGAIDAHADMGIDHSASSGVPQRLKNLTQEEPLIVESLHARDVDALLREHVTHLIAKNTRLNSLDDYSGLFEYLSKNKSLIAVSFLGKSSFHERKWLELNECLFQNKSIQKVHFDFVELSALINFSNRRDRRVVSRDFLDALSQQYAKGAQVVLSAMIPGVQPIFIIRKRPRELQAQLPEVAASSSEPVQLVYQTQATHFGYAHRTFDQPSQALPIRDEARTARTCVIDEATDELDFDMHAAQSSASMQSNIASISMDEAALSDDGSRSVEQPLESQEQVVRADKRQRH